MTDDFLTDLRADWRAQETGLEPAAEFEAIRRRLRRGRWAPHLAMASDVLVAILAFAAGLWFFWMALRTDLPIFAFAAAAELGGTPILILLLVEARRGALVWRDATPSDVLRIGASRSDASLRVFAICRWYIVAIVGFVGLLWVVEFAGRLHAGDFLIFYTAFCLMAGATGWRWLAVRTRQVLRQRAACLRLLAELDAPS